MDLDAQSIVGLIGVSVVIIGGIVRYYIKVNTDSHVHLEKQFNKLEEHISKDSDKLWEHLSSQEAQLSSIQATMKAEFEETRRRLDRGGSRITSLEKEVHECNSRVARVEGRIGGGE